MKGSLWIVAVLVCALAVASLALPGLLAETAAPVHVTNESQTLDNGTQLAEASTAVEIYQNETVVANDTGATLSRGENYTLDYSTGILAANSSADQNREVRVNYTVSQPTDERTGEIAAVLALLNPIWPLLVVLGVFGALLGMISGVWS